jgi:hypothetical protein
MKELLIFPVIIIPVLIYWLFCRRLKKTMPSGFPARSVFFGIIMIVLFLLTTLFPGSNHVLAFTSVLLKLALAVILTCAYYLLLKQKHYRESLTLLFIALALWIPALFLLSAPVPGYYNPLQQHSFDHNPGAFLTLMIGGSSFLWFPIWYLFKTETKKRYNFETVVKEEKKL